ncbi:transaldolase [bacterium]|nr:transaldolase [bacterium]
MIDEIGEVVLAWLDATFGGGRHARRVDLIDGLDRLTVSNLPTARLVRFGQSPWLDDINDRMIASGELERLANEWNIRGMTSNPTIFNKSIGHGVGSYPKQLASLRGRGASVEDAYEEMVLNDIQRALDILRPVYNRTGGDDGFVSLEVPPRFGHDEEGTVEEAVRLFEKIDRPNLMIKVPSTPAGIAAFERLTALGVNVNVTLMFSLEHYRDVAAAYVRGLRARLAAGNPTHDVRSVASMFISRIDVAVNKEIDAKLAIAKDDEEREFLQAARDRVAIANTKQVYAEFRELFFGEPFQDLARAGAGVQRPLWASTGVKDPKLRDVLYVEELVAPYTVNTIPRSTLDGLMDHGQVRMNAVSEGLEEADDLLRGLEVYGIDLKAICQKLQDDGLKAFADSFDSLFETIGKELTSG